MDQLSHTLFPEASARDGSRGFGGGEGDVCLPAAG